jgi:acyl-CoA synthetase (AMP-forming)/AMP-acid ligase II
MKGYWRREDATAEAIPDGWFRSGDLARADDDGYFFIVDRRKDLIIRGGYNVYPREIEEVLYEHPAVAEAAVIGVPDAALGEEVGAAVVLKPGETVTPQEDPGVRQGAGGGLQVPPEGMAVAGAAQGSDRQDPQAGDHGPGGGGIDAMTTPDVDDLAAPLDALLIDAAFGPLRRLVPRRVHG